MTFFRPHRFFGARALMISMLGAMSFSAVLPAASADELRVIELFTSHGCSSCPPADALLGELLEQDENLLALEFHVDYWNQLVHGSDGNFVDPFSSAAYTTRQQRYNQIGLAGRPGVYTPQAVVNGKYAAVGSDRRRITKALQAPAEFVVDVNVTASDSGLQVAVEDSGNHRGEVWLLRYLRETSTEITGGENRHKTIRNHHVVTDIQALGALGDKNQWTVAWAADAEYDCAVLVQSSRLEPILGAAVCP